MPGRIADPGRVLYLHIRALTALCIIGIWSGWTGAVAQSSFYRATPREIAGRPGTLIRQEPLSLPAPFGASVVRVLYRSTGLHDESVPVSGVVIIPPGPMPPEGRPIVAWAHPTTGVEPRCAPSLAMFLIQQIQGVREMVQHGYIVAATDYPGLGTPETHPYLVGESEARAVLDLVRVARELTGAPARFAVWGHSQGGQAALFTGMMAKNYAPELDLAGVAVAAPATALATLLADDINTNGGRNLTAMTLWSWSRIFNAPIDRVVDPAATPVVDRLAGECIEFDLRHSATARPDSLARADIPVGEGFLSDRPVAGADYEKHAGYLAAAYPGFLGARRRRPACPAAGLAGLYETAVRCRKQGPVAFHADGEPRVRCA